jgi:hypothetical protein
MLHLVKGSKGTVYDYEVEQLSGGTSHFEKPYPAPIDCPGGDVAV